MPIRLPRLFLAAFLLLTPGFAAASGAGAAQPPEPATEADPSLPTIGGILQLGLRSYVLFNGYDRSGHKWVRPGGMVGDYQLIQIKKHSAVLLDAFRRRHEVYIDRRDRFDLHERTREEVRDWANSPRNPMLWHPIALPRELERGIGYLSDDEKYFIYKWYENYGWRIAMVIDAAGYWEVGFENIYADYRRDQLKERLQQFCDLLAPDQLSLYRQLTRSLTFDEYQLQASARQALAQKFQASLNPRQREAYASLRAVDRKAERAD